MCCYQFLLRIKDTDLYMGGEDIHKPDIASKTMADVFTFEKHIDDPKINYIVVKKKENRVFDVWASNDRQLYYHPERHNHPNQKFKIVLYLDGSYKIQVMNGCITFNESLKAFEMIECNNKDQNQFFEVEKHVDVINKDRVLQWSPHTTLFDTRENTTLIRPSLNNSRIIRKVIAQRNARRILNDGYF